MTTVYDLSSNFGLLKLGEFGIEPCNIWIKIFKEKLHVEVEENEIKIAHSTENYKEEGINTAVHNGNKTRLVLIKFLSHIKIKEEGHETDPKKKNLTSINVAKVKKIKKKELEDAIVWLASLTRGCMSNSILSS